MQFDKDMNSDQAELFLEVQELVINEIEKYSNKARQKFSDNITSYFCDEYESGFCYIRTKDDYVHIGWFKGHKLEDKYNLLFGNGKMIRGQKIKVFDEVQKNAIKSYIKQTYIVLVEKDELRKLRTKKLGVNK